MSDELLMLLQGKVSPVKKASSRNGGEYHSPCPICGGTDRFICFPKQEGGALCQRHGITGTWACPRGCGKGGDTITFLMEVNGLSFTAACAELKIETSGTGYSREYRPLRQPKQLVAPAFAPRTYVEPCATWKTQATKMAGEAHEALLKNPPMLRWLDQRGLSGAAVRQYHLGYLAEEGKQTDCLFRARAAFGLPEKHGPRGPVRAMRIPRGITIPAFGASGDVCRIRIRRRNIDLDKTNPKDPKYLLIAQPDSPWSAPMCLPPLGIIPEMTTWVVVEAELDAQAVHFACGGKVGVLSVLTVSGKPDEAAHRLLAKAVRILVALDFDTDKADGSNPGASAWAWWEQTYPQSRLWPVPDGKDPGEAYALGVDLREWVYAGMPPSAPAPTVAGLQKVVSVEETAVNGELGIDSAKLSVEKVPAQRSERKAPAELLNRHPLAPIDTMWALNAVGLWPYLHNGVLCMSGIDDWSPDGKEILRQWLKKHERLVMEYIREVYGEPMPEYENV